MSSPPPPPPPPPPSSREIVLTSSPDGPITAYDTTVGMTVARFNGSRSPRNGLAMAGKAYVAASHVSSDTPSGSIHLYSWWSPTALHILPVPEPVAPLAATPDGSYLFAGGLSGHVHVLSVPSGTILRSFPAHQKPVSCLQMSNDCSLIISGGDDGAIIVVPIFPLVDASSGREEGASDLILHSFAAHDAQVTAITSCMGLSHTTVISCSLDWTCKLWNLMDGTNLRTVSFPCAISGIALDLTETDFYAAGSDGFIYKGCLKVGSTKEVARGHELIPLSGKHRGAVVSVAMVNEGKNLLSAAEDGRVYVWEVGSGRVIMALGNEIHGISSMVSASGIGNGKRHGSQMGNDMNEFGGRSGSIWASGAELSRSVRDTVQLDDILAVASEDKSKAIDMLESAIAVYERLLELILKEAKGGTSRNDENEIDDDP